MFFGTLKVIKIGALWTNNDDDKPELDLEYDDDEKEAVDSNEEAKKGPSDDEMKGLNDGEKEEPGGDEEKGPSMDEKKVLDDNEAKEPSEDGKKKWFHPRAGTKGQPLKLRSKRDFFNAAVGIFWALGFASTTVFNCADVFRTQNVL